MSLWWSQAWPSTRPGVIQAKSLQADNPTDDEAELTQLERNYHNWLTSIAQRFSNVNPLGKTVPEPMEEEAETDEEEGNDDSDDTEDTHDDDDEEDLGPQYSPPVNPGNDTNNSGLATAPAQQTTNNNDIVMNNSNINAPPT